ncbi:MAG TPA: ATP-binding protein, partial [Prosthecobacter sp.]|nr:ATP-binding protein [Prosthecobacter sp.]
AAKERCRVNLRSGQDFAFNATNTTHSIRRRWLGLFADYGARIEIVYLEPSPQLILQRNAKRADPVPERVIRALLNGTEPPTLAEAHRCELIGLPEG